MSLEEALAANTAAVIALTVAFLGKNEKPAAGAAEKPKKTDKPTPAAVPTTSASAEIPTAEGPKVTAKNVADAVVEVVTKISRERGIGLLTQYGVKTASELKPADYANFVASCKAALAQGAVPATPGADLLG